MRGSVYHIARLASLAVLATTVMVATTTQALADKSKKAVSTKTSTSSAIRLNNPTLNAAEVIVTALGQKAVGNSPNTNKTNGADTSRTDSRIVSVRATPDVLTVKIDLAADQPMLDLGVYNMLGKRMADVFRGPALRGEHEYNISISDLPEGVYICILQGSNFRRAEKFYLSR
jgi:hypothetical protein